MGPGVHRMSDQGTPEKLTQALQAAMRGERDAAARLLPVVYDDLKALARARMARVPPGNTLQPTALVHEAYMRLVGRGGGEVGGDGGGGGGSRDDPGWEGRGHFFGAAARAMRDILVEQARRKAGPKAGGRVRRHGLDAAEQTPVFAGPDVAGFVEGSEDLLRLNAALHRLEGLDARKADVVLLKFFAGLEHEDIARMLGVSVPTVERDWKFARTWLAREMRRGEDPEGAAG